MNRIESGRLAKKEGHLYENLIASKLKSLFNIDFLVDGSSDTKIDVYDKNSIIRFSIKNPKGKNTQIGLYSQESFICRLSIVDTDIINFINMFFGGNNYSNYPRHRMTKKDIDIFLNEKFTNYLNEKKTEIFDIIIGDDIEYILWAYTKNNPDNLLLVDVKEFKSYLNSGEWKQNETTFEYLVNGLKLFHLQMKGSGEKYTNGYHSLMFHIHNNFTAPYLKNIESLYTVYDKFS
jgi:hypothetical protein